VALVRADVSEERILPIIRVERINELGATIAVTTKVAPSSLNFSP
jgi:hypothetical protein